MRKDNVKLLFVLLTLFTLLSTLIANEPKKCLILASYTDQFIGQKLKVDAAIKRLDKHCNILQFNLDSKQNQNVDFIEQKSLEAKEFIESWKPDIILSIDDNAFDFVIRKYFVNSETPVVFSGIEWSNDNKNYSFKNTTGIIEAAPVKKLYEQLQTFESSMKKGIFIHPNTTSSEKIYYKIKHNADKLGITIEGKAINSIDEFKKVFINSKDADFIYLGNIVVLPNWNSQKMKKYIFENASKLIVTHDEWMISFAMLGINKVIAEQGDYSAQVAIEILNGSKPSDFPIVVNREWEMMINAPLVQAANITLPRLIQQRASQYENPKP